MENQKHDHPHNHNHNHNHGHNHGHDTGRNEQKQPEAVGQEEVDLESLSAQPQTGAGPEPGEKEAGKSGRNNAAPDAEAQKHKLEIEELKSKAEAANDKYLRLMAEFDNFKRRTAKEYQQLIEQASEKLMKDIIDVRENFERAFKHHREGADPAAFIDGMKLIFSKLDAVLHKHGLEIYCEPGQAFDPELHDAMMKTAHDTVPDDHIAEVCEKGYRLKGKVIKHSKVIVSSGKPAVGAPVPPPDRKNACDGCEEEAVIEVSEDKKPDGADKQK